MTHIEIRSRIEGELTGIFFKQGEEVKKGDLLFTIDPRPFEADLKEAKGILEQNRASQILAQEKVKRYQLLAQEDYFSQIDYESLQTNLASATALVEQAQARVERAALQLNYCWIYAPIDGMMGLLQIDYGNLVAKEGAKPLSSLNQMSPIYVTFSIPECHLPSIQQVLNPSKPLTVLASYENFQEKSFQGTLQIVDNQVDPATGMIKLRAIFENLNHQLWPNQFVRTRLILSYIENGLLIPHAAVQLTPTGPVAFVVTKDLTVEQRKLVLGSRLDDEVLVLQGVSKEERVVVDGQLNLSHGAHIRIVP
jgi:multidrug efflux system membrane fusion protein